MKVLLGVDGSDLGYRALEETTRRAGEAGDELTVAILGPAESHEDLAAEVTDHLEAVGLQAEVHRLDDETGSRLVELADGGDFDRLVIGGGRRTPLGKIKLGPVAEFVLMNATTTVTLVR